MQNNKPVLSISLLVSNRIETIRSCMESIRPLLEQLSAELVAVDTVGEKTDGSIAVVREYTDQIVPFQWCNDFAAARNAGLERCHGEWFLFLDDDEWFEDVEEICEFFRSGEYRAYASATYRIRDYRNREGDYSVGTLQRMVRLEKNTRFVGRVHEYLTPRYLPCKEFGCFIHHYGYVFDTEEAHRKHSERNLSLLRPEFEQNPWDLRVRLQMVQECMYLKELQPEAERLCRETVENKLLEQNQPAVQWILTSYVRLAEKQSDEKEVLQRIDRLRAACPISDLAGLALAVLELHAAKRAEQDVRGREALRRLRSAWEVLTEQPERFQQQKILDFEVFMEASVLADAIKDGIICCNRCIAKAVTAGAATTQTATAAKAVTAGAATTKTTKEEIRKEVGEALAWRQQLRKKPILTVSLLVSNRISTIRKCLESIRPLLSAVDSELIVVDTVTPGESDGSLAVAAEYTEHIVSFPWCEDFAAARNAGLQEAKGEWFLYLDDDEWFQDVEEIIRFFASGEYLEYNSATYRSRNYTNREGTSYSTAVLGRMIRLGKQTRFVGRIHETFLAVYLPCRSLSAWVHHYGYVYATEEEKQAHRERNLRLLREELKKEPTNLRYRAQMAQELASYDNAEALRFCEETLQLCGEQSADVEYQWLLSLIFRLYEALGTNWKEAEQQYRMLRQQTSLSETAEQAICAQMTRILLLQEENKRAYPYAKRYFELEDVLREQKEKAELQQTADLATYRSRGTYLEMLDFAAFSAWQSGEYEAAWQYYERMPWEENGYENGDGLWKVFALSEEQPKAEALYSILQRCVKNESMKPVLAALLKHPAAKRRIEETMEAERGRKGRTEQRLSELPLERLSEVITERLKTIPPEAKAWEESLRLLSEESTVRYCYLRYRLSEAAALEAAKHPEQSVVGEQMAQSVRLGREFYEMLYRPDCLTGSGLEWLPADCRCNAVLTRFLEGNQRELALLLEAAKLRPELVPVMKAWLAELAKKR